MQEATSIEYRLWPCCLHAESRFDMSLLPAGAVVDPSDLAAAAGDVVDPSDLAAHGGDLLLCHRRSDYRRRNYRYRTCEALLHLHRKTPQNRVHPVKQKQGKCLRNVKKSVCPTGAGSANIGFYRGIRQLISEVPGQI